MLVSSKLALAALLAVAAVRSAAAALQMTLAGRPAWAERREPALRLVREISASLSLTCQNVSRRLLPLPLVPPTAIHCTASGPPLLRVRPERRDRPQLPARPTRGGHLPAHLGQRRHPGPPALRDRPPGPGQPARRCPHRPWRRGATAWTLEETRAIAPTG